MNRAVILTAIPAEYDAIKAHLSNLQEETHEQGTVYELGQFSANGKSWEVGIVEIGPGNAGAAMEAERAIAHFQPDVVLFVGVAGGIKDVKLGDVVAATKVYGYESGKTKLDFEPRPDVGQSSYDLINRAKAEARKPDWLKKLTSVESPNVLVAPIAAGEKVVASKKSSTFEFLRKNYGDAVAVEMEGRGFLKATHANQQVSALIIRGISDLIDSKSQADANGSQEIAARNASAFAFEILAKFDIQIGRGKKKLNPLSNITNRGTPYFVGRQDQLEQLHRELQNNDKLAICAIAGMGGVGKTELALQYGLRYQDKYPGGLCWFPVRGVDLGTQIVSFGRTELGLRIPDGLDLNEQVRYCWGHWPEGTALIVLDDVPSFCNDYKQIIEPYLPPAQSRFKVLITSRQRPGASYRRIDLDVLSPEAALELFRSLVGKERIDKELNEAEALCEWLGYLPLGLELVGRYLDLDQNLTIAKVQKRLEKKKLAAKGLLYPTEQGEMTAQLGVAAAFELSWQELPLEAQQLGCRLSLFAQAPFDWFLVESCVLETDDEEEWEQAQEELEELRNRFLVNRNLLKLTEQKTYRLHQLIREFFQTKLAQLPEADRYKRSFCEAIVAMAKKIPYFSPRVHYYFTKFKYTSLILHLAEAATVLTNLLRHEDLRGLFMGLERCYQDQGTYDQAELWYLDSLEITRKLLGQEYLYYLYVPTILNNQALLYQSQGRYDQAEHLLRQALEMELRLSKKNPKLSIIIHNLGLLHHEQGRYDEAEPLFVRALEMIKQCWGQNHPHVATTLNHLGQLYHDQGRDPEAESLLVQALEMRNQLFGKDHPEVAASLNNLGTLYSSMVRYHEAESLFVQALEMRKQLLGDDHPHVATTLNNLALLYKAQGRYDLAEPLLVQALEMTKQLLGKDHPHVATSLNHLAGLYKAQGRYDLAEPLLVEELEMIKHRLGENHPDVAQSLNNLATFYLDQRRYHEAEPLLVQALEMTKQLLRESHPDIVQSFKNLAILYDPQGSYHQAELLHLQALEITKKLLGKNHPDVAQSLNNLALLYHYQGRYEQAEPLYVKALEIAQRKLGLNHPDTVTIRDNREIGRNPHNNPGFLRYFRNKLAILCDLFTKLITDQ